jgi:hypothetical protein
MAKKRKKRRNPQRPNRPRQQAAGAGARASAETASDAPRASELGGERDASQSPSRRAERKEEARRERERRVKQARRRQRTRRIVRWAITLAVIAGIVLLVLYIQNRGKIDQAALDTAAERLNCSEVETRQDDLDAAEEAYNTTGPEGGNQIHEPPFAQGQGGVPVTAGRHSSALPPTPAVYTQPVDEGAIVHNLEHGYVLIYYSTEENALDPELVSAMEDLANGETEVLMSPYDGLSNSIDFVSWGKLQSCDPPEGASASDLTLIARGFIQEYKNGDLAPEPAAG